MDLVLLAGYLKLVPAALVRAYPRAVLNIHPALLPAFGGPGFYGRRVHEAVIGAGARVSGPTVHFVDEAYDSGARGRRPRCAALGSCCAGLGRDGVWRAAVWFCCSVVGCYQVGCGAVGYAVPQ